MIVCSTTLGDQWWLWAWPRNCHVLFTFPSPCLQHHTWRSVAAVSLATLCMLPLCGGGGGMQAGMCVCAWVCVCVCVSVFCGLFTGRRRSPAHFVLASGSRFFALKCGWSPRWIKRSSFHSLLLRVSWLKLSWSPAVFVLANGSCFFALDCGRRPWWVQRSSFHGLLLKYHD